MGPPYHSYLKAWAPIHILPWISLKSSQLTIQTLPSHPHAIPILQSIGWVENWPRKSPMRRGKYPWFPKFSQWKPNHWWCTCWCFTWGNGHYNSSPPSQSPTVLGLMSRPMFHITQLGVTFHLQQIWLFWSCSRSPKKNIWLVVGPPLWKIWVRQLGWLDINPIWMGKCQIHGNHSPPTRRTFTNPCPSPAPFRSVAHLPGTWRPLRWHRRAATAPPRHWTRGDRGRQACCARPELLGLGLGDVWLIYGLYNLISMRLHMIIWCISRSMGLFTWWYWCLAPHYGKTISFCYVYMVSNHAYEGNNVSKATMKHHSS